MSYLENLIDKPAIVIDIGFAYTKCGFAGETGPHSIIPTKIFQSKILTNQEDKSKKSIYDYKSLIKREKKAIAPITNPTTESTSKVDENNDEVDYLKEILNEFLYRIYYKILNANSRERKIVVVESVFVTEQFRNTLAHVLFKSFQAISVVFVPSHVASLYTLAISTGLVIDLGYTDCEILPIAEGVPMIGLVDFVDLGAKRIHDHIRDVIKKHAFVTFGNVKQPFHSLETQPELNEEIIEDIKLRCCFVTNFSRARMINDELKSKNITSYDDYNKLDFKFAPDCEYNLLNNIVLNIPGYLRETLFELMFKQECCQTIANLILDTILKCPIDLRVEMTSNIVLTGGTCMLNGFKNRLVDELNFLINQSDANQYGKDYLNDLPYKKLRFHAPPCHENYTTWLGGSIFGALETLDLYSIANSKFKDNEKLSDFFTINPKKEMVHI